MNFIDGVTYVSEVMALPEIVIWLSLAIVVLSVAALFGSIGFLEWAEKANKCIKVSKSLIPITLSISVICCFAIPIIAVFDPFNFKVSTDKYKVSISSDVDMKEFIDTYEIIEYDDNERTFTIKIRE